MRHKEYAMSGGPAASSTSGGHLAALEKFYDAETRYVASGGANFAEMATHIHPEVILHHGPSAPLPGDWKGIQGIERFFAAFSETWSSLDLSEVTYFEGERGVAISLRMQATARATGRELDARVDQFIVFDGGLIRDFTVYYLDPVGVSDVTRA